MRNILTILMIAIFGLSYGQDFDYHRDFEALLMKSKDSSSTYFYSRLLERFNKLDRTLTNKEMLAFQIGFTDNLNYKPYQSINIEREILDLVKNEKYFEAINECNLFLKTNPVNFTALMEKGFAYMKLNNDSLSFYKEKFLKIYRSIKFSGDGSIEHPYFVLSPLDGQTLIQYLWGGSIGMMGSGNNPDGYFVDILEMKKDGKNPVTLYFNINHAKDKMFSEEDIKNMENALKEIEIKNK
jgi:hypothetical protein